VLGGQGSLALSRQDWSKALVVYQQSIALSDQMRRITDHPYLYNGLARSLAGLGRTEEAFAAAREAVRYVEELRADLGDSALRSGFFEGKQGIYHYAVNLALQAQRPEEAFSLAERSRSRTFLDLLGSQTRPRSPKAARARWSTKRCGSGPGWPRPGRRPRTGAHRRSRAAPAPSSRRSTATTAPSS